MKSITLGKWSICRYGSRNWTVDEWRKPKNTNGNTKDNSTEKWINTSRYFQNIPSAIYFAYERELMENDNRDYTLEEAINKMNEISNRLLGELKGTFSDEAI